MRTAGLSKDSVWCHTTIGGSGLVHSWRQGPEGSYGTCMSQMGGSRAQKVCSHMARLQLPWVQEKAPGFWGRGLVEQGRPLGPLSCQGSEQVIRPRLGSWYELYLTEQIKRKVCVMHGTTMGRAYWTIKWSYLNPESSHEHSTSRDCWTGKKFVGRAIGNPTIVKDPQISGLELTLWFEQRLQVCFPLANKGLAAGRSGPGGEAFQKLKLLWVGEDKDGHREDCSPVTRNSPSMSRKACPLYWPGPWHPLRYPANSCWMKMPKATFESESLVSLDNVPQPRHPDFLNVQHSCGSYWPYSIPEVNLVTE